MDNPVESTVRRRSGRRAPGTPRWPPGTVHDPGHRGRPWPDATARPGRTVPPVASGAVRTHRIRVPLGRVRPRIRFTPRRVQPHRGAHPPWRAVGPRVQARRGGAPGLGGRGGPPGPSLRRHGRCHAADRPAARGARRRVPRHPRPAVGRGRLRPGVRGAGGVPRLVRGRGRHRGLPLPDHVAHHHPGPPGLHRARALDRATGRRGRARTGRRLRRRAREPVLLLRAGRAGGGGVRLGEHPGRHRPRHRRCRAPGRDRARSHRPGRPVGRPTRPGRVDHVGARHRGGRVRPQPPGGRRGPPLSPGRPGRTACPRPTTCCPCSTRWPARCPTP